MSTTPNSPNGSSNTGPLPAGTQAPDFQLSTTPDQRVSLSDFRGQPAILFFYPAASRHLLMSQLVDFLSLSHPAPRVGA